MAGLPALLQVYLYWVEQPMRMSSSMLPSSGCDRVPIGLRRVFGAMPAAGHRGR